MNAFSIVVFTLLLVAVPTAIVWFLILPLKKSTLKFFIFSVTILATLIVTFLFAGSSFLPKKINRFIDYEMVYIENQINQISPDYTQKVLDTETVNKLISDSRQIRSYLESNEEVGFVVRNIGVGAYLSYLENFVENVDFYLYEFESTGTPFTLHNIFLSIKDKSQQPILKTVKIIEIIILVFGLIVNVLLLIWAVALKKGWMGDSNDGVVFGDDVK